MPARDRVAAMLLEAENGRPGQEMFMIGRDKAFYVHLRPLCLHRVVIF